MAIARWMALAGGIVILAAGVLVVASVLLRWTTGASIRGDVELVQIATAVSGTLFLTVAQLTGTHVIVDVVTAWAGPSIRRALAVAGGWLAALVFIVSGWRTALGAYGALGAHVPVWAAHVALLPGLVVAALIAVFARSDQEASSEGLDLRHRRWPPSSSLAGCLP